MDIPLVIRRRLRELGLEHRALAVAAQVTESYISQLLAGKKAPPAPNRTVVYEKMERFLKLPRGKLSKLAEAQRKEAVKKRGADPAARQAEALGQRHRGNQGRKGEQEERIAKSQVEAKAAPCLERRWLPSHEGPGLCRSPLRSAVASR